MKYITYGMPDACKHCGNTDRKAMAGDWTHVTCNICHKTTPYVVLKEEER